MLKRVITSVAAIVCAFTVVAPSVAKASNYWSQFLHDEQHSSYSPDTKLSATKIPQLGIRWMANLFNTDLGSPVVAYNSTLNKTIAYVGNERADVFAVDTATGQELWSTNVGLNDKLRATPMVAPDGSVWVGTSYNPTLYKLNGATGAVECKIKSTLAINGSPMIATPPGGVPTVYWDSLGSPTFSGPLVATRVSDCSQIFSFTQYFIQTGSWTTPAYGIDKNGQPLVIIGSADPDTTMYAVNALTGALSWTNSLLNPPSGHYDVGAASTISPPGKNGFTDGIVYVNSKYGVQYAIDLTTGANIWQFQMYPTGFNGNRNSIGSSAFDGTTITPGYLSGVFAINATSGAQIWNYVTPAEVVSSPAIVGPSGSEAVAFGDLTGAFRVVGMSGGAQLYSFQTGGYITSSPATVNGSILIASSDGFLYSFTAGGGNAAPPTSAVTSPSDGSKVPNPNGNLTITGTSSDPNGVSAVEIAVQTNGTSGNWYNAASGNYGSAPFRNAGTLATPGATSSTWTFSLPAPAGGGTFKVFANTVGTTHVVDRGAASSFTISPSKNQPILKVSTGFVTPAGTFTSSGNAFKPGETVNFTLLGVKVATAIVGSTGNIPKTTINVPSNATFGPTSLTATGVTSGKTATATVYITNDWTQFGYNSLKTSNEINDPIIKDSIDVGPNSILSLSWLYPTGAPVNTSPAVVNGVAYVGNDAGVMTAVRTPSGSQLWKYTIPSHAAIRSSPAITASGSVVFGANDGNLYILSSAGALLNTVALGGNLGNPAVADSKILIASDAGRLYLLDDTSGAIVWSVQLSGPSHASPAYDASNKIVLAGDDTGAITALDATAGTLKWRDVAKGAITGAPAVSSGVLYVTSADGKLYAMKELTGTPMWHFLADGPIQSGVVVGGGGGLTFGTNTATMYQVDSTGSLRFRQANSYGATPIIGVSGTESNQVGLTSGGLAGVTRDNGFGALNPWVYKTGAGLASSPAIINGTLYIGAGDGNLYAFTPQGATPMNSKRAVITITDQNSWSCAAQP